MPSADTACWSAVLAITTLWPIAATGILPACFRLMVKLPHEAGTAMEPTLYCIASLPSIVVAQLVTTAAGLLSVAGAGVAASVAAGGVSAGVGVGASVVAGGVSAGAGSGVVAGGVAVSAAGGGDLPQADKASTQAMVSRTGRVFMRRDSRRAGVHMIRAGRDMWRERSLHVLAVARLGRESCKPGNRYSRQVQRQKAPPKDGAAR